MAKLRLGSELNKRFHQPISHVPIATPAEQALFSFAEYLVLAAAVGNTFSNTCQLATQTVPSGATESTYRPIFILGEIAFHLRVGVEAYAPRPRSGWTFLLQRLRDEITPYINQAPLIPRWKEESHLSLLIHWLTSLIGVCYLTSTTVVF